MIPLPTPERVRHLVGAEGGWWYAWVAVDGTDRLVATGPEGSCSCPCHAAIAPGLIRCPACGSPVFGRPPEKFGPGGVLHPVVSEHTICVGE